MKNIWVSLIGAASLGLAACGRTESHPGASRPAPKRISRTEEAPLRSTGTGVHVNGRELNSDEVRAFRQILPGLFPGRWRMEENGDFGPEGKRPVLNLVALLHYRAAAQARARMQAQEVSQAQAAAMMRQRNLALQQMYASQGWGWNPGAAGNWAQGNTSGALSTYDRTGTGVYGDSNGLVGVMTGGGSWYPGQ